MDPHEPADGTSFKRKSAFPDQLHSEGTAAPGSCAHHNKSETPEDATRFTGMPCPGGMTLACSVYRKIGKAEDFCRE